MISTNCCIHTDVPPDDGPRYARNMYRLTKYTKKKLCICWLFLYTIYLMYINPLALELDIYNVEHHLCKMLMFYEPRNVTPGNTRHFVEE